MPKVSICIPAYNQVQHLKKTIDSVIVQNYKDYELIVTDDSSTTIVADFIKNNYPSHHIKYYKNTVALGTPENWNESIRKATGEYIKILHHDDWLATAASLGKYVSLLDDNPQADFAFSATEAKSANGDWDHILKKKELNSIKENPLVLYTNNLIGAPSTGIFRKDLNVWYDPKLKWLVDIDFYIRALNANTNIAYTKEMLMVTYLAEGRVTDHCINNKEVEIFEYFYLLDKIYCSKNKYPKFGITACILQAISICDKYAISNVKEIRECGYAGKVPQPVKAYLSLKRSSSLLAKGYKKVLRNSKKNN